MRIMNMRLFLMGFLLCFTVSCGSAGKVNVSTDSFFSNLTGVYEVNYDSVNFEIWVEEIDKKPEQNEHFISVFIFEKKKASDIQQFLTRYQDAPSYVAGICKYVEENPDKFADYDLKTSPSLYYDISADQIWKWDKLGGLSYFILSSGKEDTSFDAFTVQHYIDLPKNDEHGVKGFDTNAEGKVTKVHLLETGFIKKPWNYLLSGPSLKVNKISSEPKGVLKQYLNIREESRELFIEAGKNNRSYCDTN